jgi:hypothetical protein
MYVNDLIRTNGLQYLVTNGDRLHVCSAEPTTYAEATSTYDLGHWSSIGITGPTSDGAGGEYAEVPTNTNSGMGSADGTALFFAIVDTAGSALLVVNALSDPATIVSGSPFSSPSFRITMPKETTA